MNYQMIGMMMCSPPTEHSYQDETISYLIFFFYHGDQQNDTKIITLLEYKTICFGVNGTVIHN